MDSKLLLFLFLILNKKETSNGENKDHSINSLNSLSNFLKTMEIKANYTKEKIRILKKVGPYFPEEYIELLNRSILYTERIIKFNELMEFMKDDEYEYVTNSIKVKDNKDRISKILNTVQEEAPDKYDDKLGILMDLIVNMDKYKTMFSLLTSVTKNPDSMKDPTKLIETLAPLLGGEAEGNKAKIKEMSKMMEIMNLLNTPEKEK